MIKYSIHQIKANEAEEIWSNSPQTNIFTHPNVINKLAHEVHWWIIYKGEEDQCIWPITLNKERKPFIPPFSYWQGPMWTAIGYRFPNHRSISKVKPIYELFIKTFIEKYGNIKASLHPSLSDVRAFDWWNYNQPELPRFTVKPRYTAVITNLQKPVDVLQKNFRTDRRQALKKFKKIEDEIYFNNECSNDEFIWLYKEKLKIEKEVTDQDLISLLKIVNMGYGWIQAARQKKDDLICGLMIVFFHHNRANLVINIGLEEYKKEGLIPASVFKLLQFARSKGIDYFDFNGANSPDRGDDKHSYDAEPVLYFDIAYPV